MSDWEVINNSQNDWEVLPKESASSAVQQSESSPSDFNVAASLKQGGKRIGDFLGGAGETFYNVPENVANVFGKHLYQKGDYGSNSTAANVGRFAAPFALGGPEARLGYLAAEKLLGPGGNALMKAIKFASSGFTGGGALGAELGQDPSTMATLGAVGGPLAAQGVPAAANALKQFLNPSKFIAENIAKNVLNTKNAMIQKYSGPEGLYTNLFKKARESGIGNLNYDPWKINVSTIAESANPKYTEKLSNFLNNPDIENAHWAQSDLGKYIGAMKNKNSLVSSERDALKSSIEARNHLRDLMFKENPLLADEYGRITKGYRKEVVPYASHKGLQAYESGELLPEELLPKLSKGKFAATRGKFHPEIRQRNALQRALKLGGIVGGAGLLASELGNPLKFLGIGE